MRSQINTAHSSLVYRIIILEKHDMSHAFFSFCDLRFHTVCLKKEWMVYSLPLRPGVIETASMCASWVSFISYQGTACRQCSKLSCRWTLVRKWWCLFRWRVLLRSANPWNLTSLHHRLVLFPLQMWKSVLSAMAGLEHDPTGRSPRHSHQSTTKTWIVGSCVKSK